MSGTRAGGAGRKHAFAVAGVLVAAAAALWAPPGRPAAWAATPDVALKEVAALSKPDYVDNAPGARGLLFAAEQEGRIEVLRRGHVLRHPFLDIRRRVVCCGELGLYSFAFDPGYARNGRFYVDYANNRGDVEIDQFRLGDSSLRAAESSRRKVLAIDHSQSVRHYGGQLQFDARGRLYVSVGDGGTPGDPENDAQSRRNLLGKILRIDPKPRGGYTVPRSNPFVGRPGRDEILALGLRNPWRFSFDRKTGDMWIGDVGWKSLEEIEHTTPGEARGGNFGWSLLEGDQPCGECPHGSATPPPSYIPPVHTYPHMPFTAYGNAIVGGYVVRDRRLAGLSGRYVYADVSSDLMAFDPGTGSSTDLGLHVELPTSFGEGRGGRIYVASWKGPLYRLVAR